MNQVRPNSSGVSLLTGAPLDLTDLEWGLRDTNDDSMVIAFSSSMILELGDSGTYRRNFSWPATEGVYLPVWLHDDIGEIADEDLITEVIISAPQSELLIPYSYATRQDLDDYLEDGLPEGYDNDYFDRVLQLASQDVDYYSSAITYRVGSGLKFATTTDPFEWEPIYTAARGYIAEATCAQAEYRLAKGDQFFVEVQRREGEFSTSQIKHPRFGPKAKEALRRTGLRLRTASVRMI